MMSSVPKLAIVPGPSPRRVCEPSEWPQSIIDRNHDHVLLSNKARKVIGVLMPSGISTPMDPNMTGAGSVPMRVP